MTPTDRAFAVDRLAGAADMRDRAQVLLDALGVKDPDAVELVLQAFNVACMDGGCEGCRYAAREDAGPRFL